jgi:hypothetical protein
VTGVQTCALPICRLAVASKSGATGKDAFGSNAIHFQALRLEERAFVPLGSQPLQGVQDSIYQLRLVALDIGVLNAEEHYATLVTGEHPIEKGSSRAAYVEEARW